MDTPNLNSAGGTCWSSGDTSHALNLDQRVDSGDIDEEEGDFRDD